MMARLDQRVEVGAVGLSAYYLYGSTFRISSRGQQFFLLYRSSLLQRSPYLPKVSWRRWLRV